MIVIENIKANALKVKVPQVLKSDDFQHVVP